MLNAGELPVFGLSTSEHTPFNIENLTLDSVFSHQSSLQHVIDILIPTLVFETEGQWQGKDSPNF